MSSSTCRGVRRGSAEPALKRARHERDDNNSEEPPRSSDRFSNLPPDALTLVLKYAQPSDNMHRFEFAWSMGKICKTLREHCILDAVPAGPFYLEDFEEYTSFTGNDEEAFDCRTGLLQALVNDSAKCGLISELHISRESIEKHDGKVDSGIIKSLRSLLTRKGVFKNAKGLHINLFPSDWQDQEISSATNIPLLTKNILRQMPNSFPIVTDVTFGHCFCPEALMAKKVFENFFGAFKLPLQSITLTRNSFLHERHISKILPRIGSSLRCLSIDGAENESIKMVVGNDHEHSLFTAICENCKSLELLSLCGLYFYSVDECLRITFDSIPGIKELVLKDNEYPLYDPSVDANEYITGRESEPYLAAVFQRHGAHLETLRCDFSDIDCASDALNDLVTLQRSTMDGAPNSIKLRTVDIKNLHTSAILYAIVSDVKEFIMCEQTQLNANEKIQAIFSLLSVVLASSPALRHSIIFRFCKLGVFYTMRVDEGKLIAVKRLS